MKKCNIEGGEQMKDSSGIAKLKCNEVTTVTGAVATATIEAMKGEFVNPYDTKRDAVQQGSIAANACTAQGEAGTTRVFSDLNTFYVHTCFSSDAADVMSNQFMVE